MKTNLLRTSAGIIASGFFAAAALAGPGPQFWNRPTAAPAPKADAPAKPETPPPAKCDGCKTTKIWEHTSTGPAGKGTSSARVVGSRHSCARCAGAITNQSGKVTDAMTHNPACGPLLCCK